MDDDAVRYWHDIAFLLLTDPDSVQVDSPRGWVPFEDYHHPLDFYSYDYRIVDDKGEVVCELEDDGTWSHESKWADMIKEQL